MAHALANGATVETKAIFVKSFSGGVSTYRRMPFNIETRTYPTKAKGGRKTYMALILGGGHTPGRANAWDQTVFDGELYDAIEYYDVYPDSWPRIGETAG
jgi:hypothetical protein